MANAKELFLTVKRIIWIVNDVFAEKCVGSQKLGGVVVYHIKKNDFMPEKICCVMSSW